MSGSPIYHADLNLLPVSTEASFLKMKPKLLAIPDARLQRINLPLTLTISITQGASEKILTLRDDIVRHLPLFDLAYVDELDDAAHALDHTHGWVQATSHPSDHLEELNLEATQTRARAISDLRNLATHGLIDASRLSEFVGKPGYKFVIADMRLCCRVYELEWANIDGKTCTTREEVERAAAVVHLMERLIGLRRVRGAKNEWGHLRDRAFTLLFNHYGEARRAVQYLRYPYNDADKFAPSLFKARMKRRRQHEEDQTTKPVPSAPIEPVGTGCSSGDTRPIHGALGKENSSSFHVG